MTVMAPREKWTDERLDDLNKKVDEGFARLGADIRELRVEIKDLRGEVTGQIESLRSETKNQIEGLKSETKKQMEGLQGQIEGLRSSISRNVWGAAVAIIAALIGSGSF
jgi:Sec-independent protein translocase protein TatA